MNIQRILPAGLMAVVLLAGPVGATDSGEPGDGFDSGRFRPQPKFQLGLRLDYRLDDRDRNDYTPGGGVRFFYNFHLLTSLTVGFIYNNHTRESEQTSFRTLAIDFGFRFRSPEKIVSPIFEAGYVVPVYWGITNGRRYRDTKLGVRFGVGLSFNLSRTSVLDLTVSQTLNYLGHGYNEVMMPPLDDAPCPIGSDCTSYRNPESAYNAARLEMLFRFEL